VKPSEYLLMAKSLSEGSKCWRRKIATVIPIPCTQGEVRVGINGFSNFVCNDCTRMIECPALHSEVQAIINCRPFNSLVRDLYVWAEVPCLNCLSFIHHQSEITTIYCLAPSLYEQFYGRVKDYSERIALRRAYAKRLELTVIEIDEL
jgi:deoxycytidylate deaminase